MTIVLFSCGDGNYTNVSLEGYVRDSETKTIIPNSKIQVTCWVYDTEIWESRKVKKEVKSNKEGFYLIHFEKGEAMDIIVSADRYGAKELSITLRKNKNKIDFSLTKRSIF